MNISIIVGISIDYRDTSISGGGNDGTAFGSIASTEDRFGNPDAAYLFDGKNDYISIPNTKQAK